MTAVTLVYRRQVHLVADSQRTGTPVLAERINMTEIAFIYLFPR